jgi:hypothetical protein
MQFSPVFCYVVFLSSKYPPRHFPTIALNPQSFLILILYNKDTTNIENTLADFNSIHPNIQFTIEKEIHNSLNYLDLTITKMQGKLTFSIFRKPTSTVLIIHNDSCHPQEHKNAAINYLTNRMNTYPITDKSRNHERQHIKVILHNNNYPTYRHERKHKPNHSEQNKPPEIKKKWATFTYIGKETRVITKLLKNTNIRTSFRTTNTIKNHLKPRKHISNIYNESGIYQLKCKSCPLKYVGPTGRNFQTRFKEHIQAIRTNKPNSKFAQHILDTQHTYGTIDETMDILHFGKKGPQLNTLERFYIHNLCTQKLQINDTYTDTYNPIFNLIQRHITHNNKPLTKTPPPP